MLAMPINSSVQFANRSRATYLSGHSQLVRAHRPSRYARQSWKSPNPGPQVKASPLRYHVIRADRSIKPPIANRVEERVGYMPQGPQHQRTYIIPHNYRKCRVFLNFFLVYKSMSYVSLCKFLILMIIIQT